MSQSIQLRHSRFNSSSDTMITGQCGPLRAYEVASANNTFTSQLNVTITDEVVGKTVQCLYDDGRMEAIVGTDYVTLSSGQKYTFIAQLTSYYV